MELRDRAVSPSTRSHSARDRGLLGAEELAAEEPVSGPQLQWATHTEFPTIVRLLELNCCAVPLTAAGGGSVFAAPAKAVASLDVGDALEARSSFSSQMDRQELHILRTLARWYSSRLLPSSRASWILSPKFQRGLSDSHQTDGCHIHRRWSDLLHGTIVLPCMAQQWRSGPSC